MEHLHRALARETKRVLAERQWSTRVAFQHTGVGASTISNMARGFTVRRETLEQWATAIGEPVEDWLTYGGLRPVVREKNHTYEDAIIDEEQKVLALWRELKARGLV